MIKLRLPLVQGGGKNGGGRSYHTSQPAEPDQEAPTPTEGGKKRKKSGALILKIREKLFSSWPATRSCRSRKALLAGR